MRLNFVGGGLALFLLLGAAVLAGFKSRKGILLKCQTWLKSMEKEEQEPEESKQEPGEQEVSEASEEPDAQLLESPR